MGIIDDAERWPGLEYRAGITDELTNEDYHALKWAVSSSYLKTAFLRGEAAARKPVAETPSMRLGTAVHTLVLEGADAYLKAYAEAPEGMRFTTKAGKEWKAEAEEAGKIVLNRTEADKVADMAGAVRVLYEPARAVLDVAPVRERSIIWRDEAHMVWCRCRPDAYRIDEHSVRLVDLKTCADLDRFEDDFYRQAYDIQLAFYLRGLAVAHYGKAVAGGAFNDVRVHVVAVESSAPYRVGVYRVPDTVLAEADSLVDLLLWRAAMSGWFGTESPRMAAAYRRLDGYTGCRNGVIGKPPSWVDAARDAWVMQTDDDRWRMANFAATTGGETR